MSYDVNCDVIIQKCLEKKEHLSTYESVGRGFESLPAYQIGKHLKSPIIRDFKCFFYFILAKLFR